MADAADRRRIRAALDRFGVKRLILAAVALAWLAEAWAVFTGASDAAINPDPSLFHLNLPIWLRVSIWGLAGLVILASLPRWQQGTRYQMSAWFAAVVPLMERAASYWGGWVVSLIAPLFESIPDDIGVPGAWGPAVRLTSWALALWAIAAIREAPPGYVERRQEPRA